MPFVKRDGSVAVICGCDFHGPAMESRDDAIAAWNTRAAPLAPIAEGVTCVAKPLTEDERKAAIDKWIAPPAMDREAVAKAIGDADAAFGYSCDRTRLVDGVATYTLTMSGHGPAEFDSIDDAHLVIAERRNAARADAILSTLSADAIRQGEGSLRDEIRSEIINTPETADFMAGVPLEAAHQRERWGVSHDGGKTPFDWFWLIGYLAQKAASSQVAGDMDKALHHTISTAAALANWHAQISGRTDMRPGIGPDNGGQKDGSAYSLASALATPASHASDGGKA
ncbi:hypothetical protein ACQR50_10315 [Sphingomonas sp. Xoc002]|uniref:hypothetical protein n=1 Tax=Sphingomonas sp. Xoc002 TaxID=2837624 RepID=UPI003D1642B5